MSNFYFCHNVLKVFFCRGVTIKAAISKERVTLYCFPYIADPCSSGSELPPNGLTSGDYVTCQQGWYKMVWESTVCLQCLNGFTSSPGSSVGNDAGCQPRGCEFESLLGQLSFRHLTKVIATCVIRLPPMG